ncbi:unnamed protein product [Owenia fusiformis]|uniref:Uncharacterized protein n=1 Tax=Owenia fusiformis TaxID=6347 RepID=A0A8J1XTA2_OWEFU|nr:unnamed protein product [Owenia fusiformis]
MVKIAVVGAGVIGLSTAVKIQEEIPEADVTIFADKFNQATTSDGAAGIYRITSQHAPGTDIPTLRRWGKDSWDRFSELSKRPDASKVGALVVSGYQLYNDSNREQPLFADYVGNFRNCTEEELNSFGVKYKHGWFFTTVILECRWYLPFLMKTFRRLGGKVVKQTISSLEEFVGRFDLVINCSALGSKSLVNDQTVFPVRGQMIRAHAPWVKHFIYTDDMAYILPCQDNVVLGGTRQAGNYNKELDAEDTNGVWERCKNLLPSIEGARWDWQWVGLRPTRHPVRVEIEQMKFGNKTLPVVHNYGHGANGVTLSWGTAVHAAQLAKQVTRSLPTKSRL